MSKSTHNVFLLNGGGKCKEMASTSSVTDIQNGSPVEESGSPAVSYSLVIHEYTAMSICTLPATLDFPVLS